ncbi:Na+/H+ antiporter subunit E [Phaeobacter sp. CNT1-3]|nr:Na+/H+ antiporter subunit E [Phaeobacter sp. CNT1-3]
MTTLVANIFLALIWVLFFGGFTWLTTLSGLVVGYAILWLLQPLKGAPSSYFRRVWYWARLIVMFHYELLVSSLQVLWDIFTPTHLSNPAIIEMPLDVKTDAGILLTTNLISLTPGTLSIDVSEDRKTLILHVMFADDPDAVRRQLKQGMERWVIDAMEGDMT